ncbi:MAG TPA: NADH-quinone oxidoreductase subunit N [Myxococcota bacterium]|nr:NADH-quinone oxidoreductase subunit N [Myxococcota bacterium]HRY92715.1 NADH-quinone oxidoreductase subunit N [Myxococcota bacterium]
MSLAELFSLLPVLVLAGASLLVLMLGLWLKHLPSLVALGVAACAAAGALAVLVPPEVMEVGGMFSAARYARFFLVLWAGVVAWTLLSSVRYAAARRFQPGEWVSLLLFAGAGMALLSAATSLVGMFLGLEAFTLVLYILIAFHRGSAAGTEAGLKYLVLGVTATAVLAFGVALVYASAGTFHLPEAMAGVAGDSPLRPLGLLGWGMLLVAIGFKVSLVPFHLWTPDVYQGAPAPVAGLLAAGSKGAMFSAVVGLLAGIGLGLRDLTPVLWALSGLSMLLGTLAALRQENVKRMLAYSSVVHMGFVLMGLLDAGPEGQEAVVFYLVFYALVSLGAFGVLTAFSGEEGEPQQLAAFRGAGYRHPFLAAALAVFMLALAGVPPTGGFMAKLGVFAAAIRAGHLPLALVGVLASLVSLVYYLKLVIAMYMSAEGAPPSGSPLHRGTRLEAACVGVCLLGVLLLGLAPGALLDWIGSLL